jgi:hypothetical protein
MTKSLPRLPEVGPADGVKDGVHAIAGEAVKLFDEVPILVVDRNASQVGYGLRTA